MAKYKIGEIAASTGIEPFTLKYYEKEGLLAPESDKATGYRYYGLREIGDVLVTHQLRQWKFPLKDIRALRRGLPANELEQLYASRLNAVQEQIDRLLDVRDSLAQWITWQENFYRMRGTWEIADVSPFYYWEHRGAALPEEKSQLQPIPKHFAQETSAHLITRTPLERIQAGELDAACCGFAQLVRQEEGPPQLADCDRLFPGGQCLIYYFSEPDQHGFSAALLQKGLDAVEQERLCLSGDVYATFLPESLSDGVRMGNYIAIFPVKKQKFS